MRYSNNLGSKELHIFEVDESFLTDITASSDQTVAEIKIPHSYDTQAQRQAMLSTSQRTYKLKQSETSNMLMAVDLNKASKT